MGASNYSGTFNKSPDYFDGEAKESRFTKTSGAPDLYNLLKESATRANFFTKAAADGAAATATAETPFYFFDAFTKSVRRVTFVPSANLTADNTNFATMIVRARKGTGALSSIIAQATTQITGSGNWTAFAPVTLPLADGTNPLTLDAAKLDMLANWSLTLEITKSGTGVVVPAGLLHVTTL